MLVNMQIITYYGNICIPDLIRQKKLKNNFHGEFQYTLSYNNYIH